MELISTEARQTINKKKQIQINKNTHTSKQMLHPQNQDNFKSGYEGEKMGWCHTVMVEHQKVLKGLSEGVTFELRTEWWERSSSVKSCGNSSIGLYKSSTKALRWEQACHVWGKRLEHGEWEETIKDRGQLWAGEVALKCLDFVVSTVGSH